MEGIDWGKVLSAFLLCSVKPGLGGLPAAVFAFKFTFLQTLIICGSGGITGTLFFSFAIDGIIKGLSNILDKHFPNRNLGKRKFTRKNKIIIKAKKNFGIPGIAIISPILLSIPLGVFLAIRFFGNRNKVILYMSVSVIFWTILLYIIYTAFGKTLLDYL